MLWEAAVEVQYWISDLFVIESHAGDIDTLVENIPFIGSVRVYF